MFLSWPEVVDVWRDSNDLDGTLTLLGQLGQLGVHFLQLLALTPVFTSLFRGHQNLFTTFFSYLGFLVLLNGRVHPFLGLSESPAR